MEKGYITFGEHNIVYEWKIDKLDRFYDGFEDNYKFTFNSSEFSTGAKMNDKWSICLDVITQFNVHNNPQSMAILDVSLNSMIDVDNINIKYSSIILDHNKKKLLIMKRHLLLTNGRTSIYAFSSSLLKNKDKNLSDNTFTIYLDLTVYDTPQTTCQTRKLKIPKCQMAHDYTELYNTKMSSDVIIDVRNTEFPAHKIILMARSPVLAAMFSHDMIEKKENKISIPDVTPEIFEKVLKYIYTDEVTDLDADAKRLLEAADKYQLRSLKDICQESLSETLTVDNALEIMTLADRHSAKHLLEFTNKFMELNIKKIIESQNFKEFKKSNLPLAFELLEKFSILKL
ncbi:speckle-type POZ protein-like [Microplitis mediator]|uniref:speckle-type POZ protein-like n=1 Tax=Microplitis mediator TaxID=375433 RepID=UPI0025571F9B|nr:speckle-type POZ protein-like [Microplitis mediator]